MSEVFILAPNAGEEFSRHKGIALQTLEPQLLQNAAFAGRGAPQVRHFVGTAAGAGGWVGVGGPG
jgi:hypothetical protein